MWDISTGNLKKTFEGHRGFVYSVFVSGDYLFTGDYVSTVKMWDADPNSDNFGNEVRTFSGHSGSVPSVFVSGDYLFTGSNDKTVKMWDADPNSDNFGNEVRTFSVNSSYWKSAPNSVFVSGNYLFVGLKDNTAKMWLIPEFKTFTITNNSGSGGIGSS
jgi:WD40 repeat protein